MYVAEHTTEVVPVVMASLTVSVHCLAILHLCNSAFSDLILFFQQSTKHAYRHAYGFDLYVYILGCAPLRPFHYC